MNDGEHKEVDTKTYSFVGAYANEALSSSKVHLSDHLDHVDPHQLHLLEPSLPQGLVVDESDVSYISDRASPFSLFGLIEHGLRAAIIKKQGFSIQTPFQVWQRSCIVKDLSDDTTVTISELSLAGKMKVADKTIVFKRSNVLHQIVVRDNGAHNGSNMLLCGIKYYYRPETDSLEKLYILPRVSNPYFEERFVEVKTPNDTDANWLSRIPIIATDVTDKDNLNKIIQAYPAYAFHSY